MMEQKISVKEQELISEEASIRADIINLLESKKKNDLTYSSFLEKWKPLSERLDGVIIKIMELESQRFRG